MLRHGRAIRAGSQEEELVNAQLKIHEHGSKGRSARRLIFDA
jgi:hypothetical protein